MKNTDDFMNRIKFDDKGLVTAVAQDHTTGEILMLAHMNAESLKMTIETGQAVYWSRSRQKLWHKGEESGNVQNVKELYLDCDGDALVIKIDQVGGAACHTGHRTCFYRRLQDGALVEVGSPVFDPEKVYKHKGE